MVTGDKNKNGGMVMKGSHKSYGLVSFIILVLGLMCAAGVSCTSQEKSRKAPPPPEPQFLEHTVKYSGETLGIISKWYTGQVANWKLIADANPGLRPERISIGDTILVPKDFVTNSEPMPQSAVPRARSQASSTDASTTESLPEPSGTDAAEPAKEAKEDPEAKLAEMLEAAIKEQEAAEKSAAGAATAPVKEIQKEAPKPEAKPAVSEEDAQRKKLLDELLNE